MAINSYYNIGNTGLKVSRLCLGTMTFGTEWKWGNTKDESREIFNRYVELGGNFVDTADMYTEGSSERFIGDFLQENKNREDLVIATKFTFNTGKSVSTAGNSAKNIIRSVHGSLERLGTDYIDLYIMHCWDRISRPDEVMKTLDSLVQQGKVRHIAMSNVPAWYASRAQAVAEWRGYEPLSALQLEYSLIERHLEDEYTDLAQLTNAGIMAWSPLGGGLLSGKYKPGIDDQEDVEGRLKTITDNGGEVSSKDNERNWKIVKALHEVSEELAQPMASVALNWTASQPGVSTVIIGATKLHQIDANMQALDFEIPQNLMEKLNEASAYSQNYPYKFFAPDMQKRIYNGARVGSKPQGFYDNYEIDAR